MLGGFKNEKNLLATLNRWRTKTESYKVVHSLNYKYINSSELFRMKAENVFQTWDVISASLIDTNTLHDRWEAAGWGEKQRLTGIFHELAFVLEFEPQNILGTHIHDVWFPNHAGVAKNNSWALADAIFSGKGLNGGEKKWPITHGYNYNKIFSPDQLLAKSKKYHHNEVLLIGKSNIRTYPDLPATRPIKVKEIIFAPKRRGNGVSDFNSHKDAMHDKIKLLNPGVDFITL